MKNQLPPCPQCGGKQIMLFTSISCEKYGNNHPGLTGKGEARIWNHSNWNSEVYNGGAYTKPCILCGMKAGAHHGGNFDGTMSGACQKRGGWFRNGWEEDRFFTTEDWVPEKK